MGRTFFNYVCDTIFNVFGVVGLVAGAVYAGLDTASNPWAVLSPVYLASLAILFVWGGIRKVLHVAHN